MGRVVPQIGQAGSAVGTSLGMSHVELTQPQAGADDKGEEGDDEEESDDEDDEEDDVNDNVHGSFDDDDGDDEGGDGNGGAGATGGGGGGDHQSPPRDQEQHHNPTSQERAKKVREDDAQIENLYNELFDDAGIFADVMDDFIEALEPVTTHQAEEGVDDDINYSPNPDTPPIQVQATEAPASDHVIDPVADLSQATQKKKRKTHIVTSRASTRSLPITMIH